ncbi:hypothetical protein METBIDRAFT_18492, partial [Metschnikowia bicuspidata var. bicuspidata NRRL YB-4993]
VPTTIAQFLDNYSKGDSSLLDAPCPKCLKPYGFLAPPDCYRERLRNPAVEQYSRLEHWQNRAIFQRVTAQVREAVGAFGVSVLLVHKKTVYVKYETKLEFKELPRVVLLDAHAILSKGGIVFRDTAKDWRTSQNPLVTGPPGIRFYAGVSLVTGAGVAIGALAIFDTLPNAAFSSAKLKLLGKVAALLMALLDTPPENIVVCDEKFLSENPNAGDLELAELSSRLGRATCSGGHMTIFERDGSGSCYSHSHIFKLPHYEEHKQISDSMMPEGQKLEIRQALRRVKTLKSACRLIVKSIASVHKFDYVVVTEIRFMEKHRVARASLPDSTAPLGPAIPQRLQKQMLASSKVNAGRCKVRVLASTIPEHDASMLDHAVWLESFSGETACEIIGADGSSVYRSGFVMPFYVSKPSFIKKDRRASGDDHVDVYLRLGGYLIGAFSKSSNRTAITPSLVSKVYDHVKIARVLYL